MAVPERLYRKNKKAGKQCPLFCPNLKGGTRGGAIHQPTVLKEKVREWRPVGVYKSIAFLLGTPIFGAHYAFGNILWQLGECSLRVLCDSSENVLWKFFGGSRNIPLCSLVARGQAARKSPEPPPATNGEVWSEATCTGCTGTYDE